MKYGSVCSGIEAASIAWESLGWQPAWFAEIEAFPSAVLANHWPNVTNLGDMTGIAAAVRVGDVEAPDVLVGGTPCQAFSIAGLRNGLADKRGQLTLSYVELANAIDDKRRERGEEEAIIVWENVPGVLSSKDNAFGCFLAGLAGESCELQPAGGKWTHAGCVSGPERIIAWRVLDAQFFGVAQRRKRVFVVASARKGFDPAEVLFELNSVRRDTPPRREPQTAVTADTGNGAEGGSHWDNPANPHPTLNQSNNIGGIGASNQEVFSQRGAGLVSGAYSDISRTLLAKENDSTAEDLDTYILAYGGGNTGGNIDVATACTAHGVRMDFDTETFAVHGTQDPDTNHELAHTLGRNHGQENAIITEPYTIAIRGREEGSTVEVRNDGTANALLTPDGGRAGIGVGAVGWGMQVRRLTPVECERLQGFPDNHTLIPWRGKDAADCPDGPRYKAIGNSMAVPVMRWIGERIAALLSVKEPVARVIKPQVVSFSGGRSSAYLVYLMEQRRKAGEDVHFTFMDTGAEHPATYQFIRDLVSNWNIPLVCLRVVVNPVLGKGNSYCIVPVNEIGPDLQPMRDICEKYGTPYVHGAFCTRTMKMEVFKRYCRDTFGDYHTWIGIRADEPKRLKPRDGVSYLAEISDFEKQDVISWWKKQPFDLGIPEHLGNCVFCVKKGLNKLALAARDEPEMAAEFWKLINDPSVRVVERRQQENKIMYRGNNSLESVIALFADHSREEIAATIGNSGGEESGSCTESCEAFACDISVDDGAPIEAVEEPDPHSWRRPFLKWAGGKYSMLPDLYQLIPAGMRLIEPFVGGGSVFLNSDKHACFLLADVNTDLINLYQMLAVVPDTVIRHARVMFDRLNDAESYTALRDEFNAQVMDAPERAAAFLFLNRHCFNGLIRYNRNNQFNVGWGKYPSPYFPEEEIEAFTRMAHNCVFMAAGFHRTLALAGEGDVVYCDPPYEPMPGTAGFTHYAAGGFTWDDHIALAECCVAAHQRGARVVIGNSTAPRVIDLYSQHGFEIHHISARRSISSKGSTRETAKDLVAIL
ncbi:TPA: Dam family site-specific DNA-(adenine-N6)-methyltransferase [Salmonella enterica subsp. diarizonae serovar 60-67:z35:-]